MFISMAHAAGEVATTAPSMADAFWTNMGLVGIMFVLFYLLLIRPQQKRLKEQRSMLDTLQKGDKIVTGGGLYATVSRIISDTEVEIDLGGVKVTAMRYTIQTRINDDASTAVKAAKDVVAEKKLAATPVKKAEKKSVKTKPVAAAQPKKLATKNAAAKKPTSKKAVKKKA